MVFMTIGGTAAAGSSLAITGLSAASATLAGLGGQIRTTVMQPFLVFLVSFIFRQVATIGTFKCNFLLF